jgi:aminoglycoside 6'-N-acetyltransferase
VTYGFRPMVAEDEPMVRRWLQTPDVQRWWTDPNEPDIDLEDLGDPRIAMWIVSREGRPFAYLQDYDPHPWPDHHFAGLPARSRGIDQFIGEPELIGRGHGSAFIRQHVERLFAEGAPAVGTDPHPDNARAIRAYEKAGFVRGEARDTEWGLSLLMTRYAE